MIDNLAHVMGVLTGWVAILIACTFILGYFSFQNKRRNKKI